MNRRDFHGLATMGIIGSIIQSQTGLSAFSETQETNILKPKRLSPGDKVGLITPGSYIPDAGYEKAINNLTQLGLQVIPGRYVREKRGFTAGTDAQGWKTFILFLKTLLLKPFGVHGEDMDVPDFYHS